MNDRLKKLEARREKIADEIARVKAREAAQNRKEDTRRKVLLGALILSMVEKGEWPKEKVDSALARFLTRPQDRILFNLPPVEYYAPRTE
ncbi:MAG: mobilization protein [Desulfurivibrionaceae bacterium]